MILAARGAREVDGRVERIADEAERAALGRKARAVWVASALLAVLGTGAILVLPI